MSIQDKKSLIRALLWIVPINLILIILGFIYTNHKLNGLEVNQVNMKSGDSIRASKLDSLAYRMEEADSLKKLISK